MGLLPVKGICAICHQISGLGDKSNTCLGASCCRLHAAFSKGNPTSPAVITIRPKDFFDVIVAPVN
ncbi:NEDD4-like E3 ubiquitin-protein ligase WWP1 isoform 2 [Corchorus olitorius]|uniref:NEDD4-like E3 ubiquitin-protein ligase WWP1 isoform 2 n=1 Tax=Corchorus olitorius TaxID=93759 RepID=A0A1R3HYI6_9ROSI|nr:NEDD4-like E3 ubiquitin-protein ligase WWP1 isoform 2 [Corchorus olitorius]